MRCMPTRQQRIDYLMGGLRSGAATPHNLRKRIMKPSAYNTFTLPCSLRVVHISSRNDVACCGVLINAGSRDDFAGALGLAHFVEHTIFKGTTKRKAWHILNRMEAVGGELNAYTTKEATAIYSVFPKAHLARAMELIADLTMNSTFPDSELNHEREVVLEEIDSYRDTPSEAIYDDFEDIMFAGTALGHNILGLHDDLMGIDSKVCSRYVSQHFNAQNMVLFVMANTPQKRVEALANKHFSAMRPAQNLDYARPVPTVASRFEQSMHIESHQAHVMAGTPIFGMHDSRRYAMALMNNVLGGPGMNALLNVQLRERRGMVYQVGSSVSLLTDCGIMQIYLGCDHHNVQPALKIVRRTLDDLAEHGLTDRRLAAAKKQYAGQLLLSTDNSVDNALAAARSYLYHNRILTNEQVLERISSVSNDHLRQAAALVATNLSVLVME